ncbi:unnamed protein product [Sphenostylis stenocarpa]|uniref:Uncharacterized protein n=1 Tax=Sphenostylis stenocarpa TaxID=92480 RepID=A0AA86VQB1_9FABA|nr:unnamed protein product [Sphenostylis stenocarpa]
MAFATPTVPQKEQLWPWTTQVSSWLGSFNGHKLWASLCGCVNVTRHNDNAKRLQTRNYNHQRRLNLVPLMRPMNHWRKAYKIA